MEPDKYFLVSRKKGVFFIFNGELKIDFRVSFIQEVQIFSIPFSRVKDSMDILERQGIRRTENLQIVLN